MIDGIEITLGEKRYTVPPLNFKAIKKLQPDIASISTAKISAAGMSVEQVDSLVRIIHAALLRNYPGITVEEVEDGVDIANAGSIMMAVMNVSGYTASGESQAPQASATNKSTGTTSTDSSSPSTAGAGNTSTSA